MKKRIIVLFFFTFAFALWRGTGFLMDASAQRQRPAKPINFSKFKHSSHIDKVKSLTDKNRNYDLDCAYCHGDVARDKLGKDQHYIELIGYPSHKYGNKNDPAHSACTDCHAFTGSAIERDMCVICHDRLNFDPKQMATNIRSFPNPDGGGVSQFYDYFSHNEHVEYYKQSATNTALKDRVKFYDSKKDAKANKGLDKDKFECGACHTMNQAPETVAKISFTPGIKMTAPGHPECFICHLDPKVVPPPKKEKPDPNNTFATNCTGCHRDAGKPMKDGRPVKGTELAVLWFARQIINTELNPKKPGTKAPLPYSHKTHDDAVGKTVADCLSCHVTGKSADTRSDFYLQDRKTKEFQPLIWSCVDCHKKEMQTKIAGTVTLESAKCNYCHSLQTIRSYELKGVQLPPPNHFYKKPAASPTPTPPPTLAKATIPEDVTSSIPVQPSSVPAQTQATKAEEKPDPAPPIPAPAPEPTPKPKAEEAPPAAPPKPTPAPEPTPKPKSEEAPAAAPPKPTPAPEPTPTPKVEETPAAAPPKPAPAPTPAPTEVAKANPAPVTKTASSPAAPATGTGKAQMMPKMPRLGDPKDNPHWGKSDKWGVVENFDHDTHITPKYSSRCEDCHHTNKDARTEMTVGLVPLCTSCHKEKGNPANPLNKDKVEIDVELGYHGNPDNQSNNAGCIECHKRYYDKNPDADRKAPTAKCAGCHAEKQARFEMPPTPILRDQWSIKQMLAMIRALKNDDRTRASMRK